ncbi:MAG: LPS export ABC transporter ATP-binding protein [Deltaproteobacteria bacterium]|nr:LPS export ABC transporter ATP-binding protein [Deltaproteobacteria bacterium]MBW1954618.1 LPS export ABC transporter ATP-binding protein [Deltaproteobacteria bacterium]MBW2042283.1 LPS export ABC transporter ATP-binding protein [Deltaproteobacteria bacterium]MBW2131988.1 LPS export ABC transporter ATP-binding protein [Deltaproteobacteria bacterium]
MSVLGLMGLGKSYFGRQVVKDVDLTVESGSVVGLLGPNGAGKTTTFYMTVGMIKPDQGRVFLNDEEITHDPMYIRARKGVGYLPQEASTFRKLTVKENVLVVLEAQPLTRAQQEERAERLLEELGIRHLSRQKAGSLSGGERRRLEITRSLASNPVFILLDEPFSGIDPLAVIDIKNIISHLKSREIGILITDHNVRETLCICDRAFILNDGQVIESGPPEKIACSEIARRLYLGDEFRL